MKWLIITESNITVGRISKKLEKHHCKIWIERITSLKEQGLFTERQEQIIRWTFESGCCVYPRKTDSTNLTEELNKSVSTRSEMIRSASAHHRRLPTFIDKSVEVRITQYGEGDTAQMRISFVAI